MKPAPLRRPDSLVWKGRECAPKTCRDQVGVGPDFAADLTMKPGVDAADVALICPYKANVQLVEEWRKRAE